MSGKEVPVLFVRREECCGCTACCSICPKGAITMIEDDEGFDYPCIDPAECINCEMCLRVCPMRKNQACERTRS